MTSIALDVHMIGARETGNETYATELAAALGQLGGYKYLLYTPQPAALPPKLRDQPALAARAFPDLPSALRIPVLYPRLVRADAARLLHMMYVAPPHVACPVVLTVHDVSYRVFPQFFSPGVRLHLDLLVGHSVRHAARVITGSESARQDVIRYYHPPPERVVVIPAAAGAQYQPQAPAEIARVRAAYHLPERYFLAVGNLQPRKNLIRLIEAFTAVASEAPDVQLILVGRSTWRGWEVASTVARLGLETRVRCTGYVPDADLPGLYAGALGFCYPSLYEGFGLPPLEAMACGTPTITSNVSSLPEVVGDAALMVDPLAVADMAAALRRLLTDETARCEYRRRGLARAPQFSWARTALQTRDVYDVVVACRCGRYSDLCTCRRVPVGRV